MDNDIFTFSGSAGKKSKSKKSSKQVNKKSSKSRSNSSKSRSNSSKSKSNSSKYGSNSSKYGSKSNSSKSKPLKSKSKPTKKSLKSKPTKKSLKSNKIVKNTKYNDLNDKNSRMEMSNDDYLKFVREYSPAFPSAPSKYESTTTIAGPVGDKYTKLHIDKFKQMDKEFGDYLSMSNIGFSTKSMLDKLLKQNNEKVIYSPSGDSDISEYLTGNDGTIDAVVDPSNIKSEMVAFYTDLLNKTPSFSISGIKNDDYENSENESES